MIEPAVNSPKVSTNRAVLFLFPIAFVTLVIVGTVLGSSPNPRAPFLILLTALCFIPFAVARPLIGKYTLLCVYMAIFFLFYGAADFVELFVPLQLSRSSGFLSFAERVVLVGAACLVCGYVFASRSKGPSNTPRVRRDWPEAWVRLIGVAFVAVGLAATWVWQADARFSSIDSPDANTLATLGLLVSTYVHPLGIALLCYSFVLRGRRSDKILMIALLMVEMFFGILGGSKETAIRTILVLLMIKLLLDRNIPKKWMLLGIASIVVVFPLIQTYRDTLSFHGTTSIQGSQGVSKALGTAIESWKGSGQAMSDQGYDFLSVLRRATLKPTMELIVDNVGASVPYQNGYTLALTFYGMVPRAVWPTKPDTSTGRLFNRQFRVSEDPDTYISSTHLGELYWNFGWSGVICGMLLIGMLLGFMNRMLSRQEEPSVTKLLLYVATVYCLCLRIEGGLAVWYVQWLRMLLVIGVLQVLVARPVFSKQTAKARANPRFANILD